MTAASVLYSDLRLDLGMKNDQGVFTDLELARLFERATASYSTEDAQFKYAKLLALDQLLFNMAKRTSYTKGATTVQAGAMFDNLYRMRPSLVEDLADSGALITTASKVMWGGFKTYPSRIQEWPDDINTPLSPSDVTRPGWPNDA